MIASLRDEKHTFIRPTISDKDVTDSGRKILRQRKYDNFCIELVTYF